MFAKPGKTICILMFHKRYITPFSEKFCPERPGKPDSSPADDVAQSGNSYLAQDNPGIVSAQGENRDKVRIIC